MNLTPFSYLLAALVCLLGIVEVWSGPDGIGAWRLAAAALIVGLLYEWLRVRHAEVRVLVVGKCRLALGRHEQLTLRFGNSGPRPWAVMFAPALPAAVEGPTHTRTLNVAPHCSATVRIDVRATALGHHSWSHLPVRLKGPLGLGWWSRRFVLAAELAVVPDLLGRRDRAVGSAEVGSTARAIVGGGQELHHLREYRRGDPRHAIDWKATARIGSPITRVFSEDQHLEIVLLLDAGRTGRTYLAGLSQLGHYVNLAARFAEHAAALDDQVGVVAVADRVLGVAPPRRGEPGIVRVREVLGSLEARPVESDLLKGALEAQRLTRHRALIVVLTDLYGQGLAGGLTRSVRMLLARHLPVVVGLIGAELETVSERRAARWLDPYESLAAREYGRAVSRNAAVLRRQGAQALLTVPAQLESRVFSLYRQLKLQRRV